MEIKDYLGEGNYWKALKRYFSIQRLINTAKADAMIPIFNGDLGRLYSVISDIKTLLYLLENHQGNKELIRQEVDSFRSRLSNIWRSKEFLKKEPQFDKALSAAATGSKDADAILRRVEKGFDSILQAEAKKLTQKWAVRKEITRR